MAGSNVNRGPFGRATRSADLVEPAGRLLVGRALRILALVVGLATGLLTSVAAAVAADVVTVSHEHGDHNGADGVAGSPVILRGLKA